MQDLYNANYCSVNWNPIYCATLKNKNIRLGIAHAKMGEFALNWSKNLRKNYGEENVVLTEVGPALGVHAGPGSLVFAIQVLDDRKH